MRGEHSARERFSNDIPGSSPHARGAPIPSLPKTISNGIIPACAGSTWPHPFGCRSSEDHPRMRGEHLSAMSVIHAPAGSSPHARGALPRIKALELHGGIIPACAGSTSSTRDTAPSSRDHPRMRGEHFLKSLRFIISWGSSPHARGAPLKAQVKGASGGIIPACAGST